MKNGSWKLSTKLAFENVINKNKCVANKATLKYISFFVTNKLTHFPHLKFDC
jgi:hypothetical protein